MYCFLWIGILFRCPKFRLRSRYVIGTAVALVFWHIPGFITLIAQPRKVLCQNAITRATETNHLCAAQGNRHFIASECRISIRFFYSCCCILPSRIVDDVGFMGRNSNCLCTPPDAKLECLLFTA